MVKCLQKAGTIVKIAYKFAKKKNDVITKITSIDWFVGSFPVGPGAWKYSYGGSNSHFVDEGYHWSCSHNSPFVAFLRGWDGRGAFEAYRIDTSFNTASWDRPIYTVFLNKQIHAYSQDPSAQIEDRFPEAFINEIHSS